MTNVIDKYVYLKEVHPDDFLDTLAYNILINNTEFTDRFSDVINEYNAYSSNEDNVDNEGNVIPEDILKATENSKVINNNGMLKVVYHSSRVNFETFEQGDIGFHFGTKSQAVMRAKQIDNTDPVINAYYLNIENPPLVLQKLGANNLPMTISQGVIKKATLEKHSVDIDTIKDLPSEISNPMMIFSSDTVPNAFVVVTEITDEKNNNVIVALHLNKKENAIKINRIASFYGKENLYNFVSKQTEKGNLKYLNKEKSQQWIEDRGLQLPKFQNIINSYNNSIFQEKDIVNSIMENNLKNIKKNKINAFYDKSTNTIYLNEKAEKPHLTLLAHELYHSLSEHDQNILSNFFLNHAKKNTSDFKAYKRQKMNLYQELYTSQGRIFTEQDFWKEFSAENCETLFTNEYYVESLVSKNREVSAFLVIYLPYFVLQFVSLIYRKASRR
ncbi:MAG: hypothetical protein RR306_02275 [Clostridia bacterium]